MPSAFCRQVLRWIRTRLSRIKSAANCSRLSSRGARNATGARITCALVAAVVGLGGIPGRVGAGERPNFLLVVTDDQSWLHVGAYGDTAVQTPAFDRLAQEGVLFHYAYTAAPSCTASRSGILTGQAIWRLEEGGVFGCTLPRKFPVFPLILEEAGYFIGHTGKGWGPGNLDAGGWQGKNPLGAAFAAGRDRPAPLPISGPGYTRAFPKFLDARPAGQPFFFWCGVVEPHRPYAAASGTRGGKRLQQATLPGNLPDHPVVRSDLLDYNLEIDYLDWHLGQMVGVLEKAGLLETTVVIVTSDNGMPFPRAKANLYDVGTRMPLVIFWREAPGGRRVDDFVSLTDLAPTILRAADVPVPEAMTGRSLLPILRSTRSGRIEPGRDFVVLADERHSHLRRGDLGYPMRAIRTHNYSYIRNYAPDRWPAGDPDILGPNHTYNNVDRSPTKSWMLDHAEEPAVRQLFELAFGKRPGEELYDMKADPWQLKNLADDPAYAEIKADLKRRMEHYLQESGDPRVRGRSPWDQYPPRYHAPVRDPVPYAR